GPPESEIEPLGRLAGPRIGADEIGDRYRLLGRHGDDLRLNLHRGRSWRRRRGVTHIATVSPGDHSGLSDGDNAGGLGRGDGNQFAAPGRGDTAGPRTGRTGQL